MYEELLNKKPRRTNDCWLGDLNGNAYVCGQRFLLFLEGTALRIWQLMDGHMTVAEIVDQLNKEYSCTNRRIMLEDVIRYILGLEESGLAAWRTRPLFEEVELDD
jgi:hypothetical protein